MFQVCRTFHGPAFNANTTYPCMPFFQGHLELGLGDGSWRLVIMVSFGFLPDLGSPNREILMLKSGTSVAKAWLMSQGSMPKTLKVRG